MIHYHHSHFLLAYTAGVLLGLHAHTAGTHTADDMIAPTYRQVLYIIFCAYDARDACSDVFCSTVIIV